MTNSAKSQSSRLLALDILRGITIAGMLLVNNPGSWGSMFAPLKHAEWNGLTPTDLVFPFFMFIMGISTFFSLRRYDFTPSKQLVWKIVRRTIVIFFIGIAIHWFSHFCYALSRGESLLEAVNNLAGMRILGVMQRLAICYCAAAFITILVKFKAIPWVAAGLIVVYALTLIFGQGYEISEDNVIYIIDNAILGANHMYHGLSAWADAPSNAFDPEGLFSNLPSIAHVLIGVCCGKMLVDNKDNWRRIADLFIVGTILLFSGLLLSYGLPINKNIWSPTFVLTTCGLAASLLGLLIWIIDIRGNKKWCRFFEAFGINPLFLYVLGGVLSILLGAIKVNVGDSMISLKGVIYKKFLLETLFPEFPELASCLYAIFFICLCWCFGYILYKKKIYIKI